MLTNQIHAWYYLAMQTNLDILYSSGGPSTGAAFFLGEAERKRAYRLKHRDKTLANQRLYRQKAEVKEKRKEYRLKNKDKIAERERQYYLKNKDKIEEQRKKYCAENKDKIAVRRSKNKKKLREHDSKFNVNYRMSDGIRKALNGRKNGKSWRSMVRYTRDELIERLKQTLPDGYEWGDFSNLHIDHIIPISKFNFKTHEDDDFQRCWALPNLRLLPATENISKGGKLDKPFQPRLSFS